MRGNARGKAFGGAAEARYHPQGGGSVMKRHALSWIALAFTCVLVSGCKDHQEPVKPIASRLATLFIDL
jgi:hypothetical protein